jgi:DNA-binding beta-propeller fold protein YncE
MMRRPYVAWVALASTVGCGLGDTSVRISLDVPQMAALAPIDERVANLTLVVQGDGVAPQIQTVSVGSRQGELPIGDVPIGNGLRVSLVASTAGGRLIGYGRATAPFDLSAGETEALTVRMRRPFAYVSGQAQISVFDTTLEPQQPYLAPLAPVSSTPLAVATSPDGADVATVDGTSLVLVSTADHQTVIGQATVGAGARDIAFSPDGKTLAVATATGVTLVDVARLRAGEAIPTVLAIGATDRVALSGSRAYALQATYGGQACNVAPASTVLTIDLATATPGSAPLLAGKPIADLAIEPGSGVLLVAMPCENKVGVVDGSGAITQSFDVPGPTVVAVASGRIFTVGRKLQAGASRLVLASVSVNGVGATMVELPVPEERALSTEFDTNGQAAEIRIGADGVRAVDLAVLPDGARVAVLATAEYHSNKTGNPGPIPVESLIPAIDIETWEYQLLDVATGTPLQRLRTSCTIDWTHTSLLDNFTCTRAPGQDLSATAFKPARIAVLYGDR